MGSFKSTAYGLLACLFVLRTSKQFLFIVLAFLFADLAFAQDIYKWKDKKGQWHYSDLLPPGVTAEKLEIGDNAQGPPSQASAPPVGEPREAKDRIDRSTRAVSDTEQLGLNNRRLLVLPPADPSKPLSEWIPVESFERIEDCIRADASLFAGSIVQRTDRIDLVDFRRLKSRCISVAEFKPRKEANVIVAVTNVGPDPGGFSAWVLSGRVFNGGQTIARNVVVRYRVRDARGIIYAERDISPAPQDISPLMFAEFRGQIVGAAGGSDRWVETEAKWSQD